MDVFPLLNEITAGLPAERKESRRKELAQYLNELLLHDFPSLVQLLYQVDIPEKKIKEVLKENPNEDAGNLIADLLIERQQEKIKARSTFRFPPDASEEERW